MRKENTPMRAQSSRPPVAHQLGVAPTRADAEIARQLSALYARKGAPEIIRSMIFDVFQRLASYHKVSLPRNFTSHWQPYWAAFLALNRRQGHAVTHTSFTFEPTPEQEAELDAEDKRELEVEAIFGFINEPRLPASVSDDIGDRMAQLLDPVHPLKNLEVFKVAYPLALEAAAEKGTGDEE